MFCEQLDYNLLFRWFLDLNWDEPGFDHSTFSRNRARLLEHDVAGEFFRTVVTEARELRLTSDEHFTVDGTLGLAQEPALQEREAKRSYSA
jgi:transposase